MDLQIDSRTVDHGIVVIEIAGEIDVYTAPKLREMLVDLVNQGRYHLVVDMEGVDFIDSTGLGVLVGGLKRLRAHDGSLHLVSTQERILKIFRVTGLVKVFPLHASVQAAIDAVSLESFQDAQAEEPDGSIDVSVYLADEDAHNDVEAALEAVLEAFGIEITHRADPIFGSWFRRLRAGVKKVATAPATEDQLTKLARAIEMHTLHGPQSAIDAAQGDAVAKLILALEKTSNAMIMVGSVLLVKVDGTTLVRNLSQLELAHFENNPSLFRDPSAAFIELQRAHVAGQAPL